MRLTAEMAERDSDACEKHFNKNIRQSLVNWKFNIKIWAHFNKNRDLFQSEVHENAFRMLEFTGVFSNAILKPKNRNKGIVYDLC